jgi:predicted Zn-dependent peptidase
MRDAFDGFKSVVLPNGLALHAKRTSFPGVVINVVVHAGARQDPSGKEGLAHLLEHCIAVEVEDRHNDWFDLSGGDWRASTGFLHTTYSFQVPATKKLVQEALVRLMDIVAAPPSKAHVAKQKTIVGREFDKNWSHRCIVSPLLAHQKTYLGDHPSARFVDWLGTPETFRKITYDDLVRFHQTYCTPFNMSVVAVGGMRFDTLVRIIENTSFGEGGGIKRPIWTPAPLPEVEANCHHTFHLSTVFKEPPSTASFEAAVTLPIDIGWAAKKIFIRVFTDLVYEELRKERDLLYSVHIAYDEYGDIGVCKMRLKLPPDSLGDVGGILRVCVDQCGNDRLLFDRAKSVIAARLPLDELDTDDVCRQVCDMLVEKGRITTYREILQHLRDVLFEDMQRIVSLWASERVATFVMRP